MPSIAPSTSLATLRPDLGGSMLEFDLAMDAQGFVATRVLPVFEAAEKSGTYGLVPIEQLLRSQDVNRAPGADYAHTSTDFTERTYATTERGLVEIIDDNTRATYRNFFDAELIVANKIRRMVMEQQERETAAAIFDTSVWTGSDLFTNVSNEWSNASSGTPIADVKDAVQKIRLNSGVRANALVISDTVARNLRQSDDVINRIIAAGAGVAAKPNDITDTLLAAALGIDMVLVAGAIKNTAADGAAFAGADVWDDEYAMVCRVAGSSDIQEPCIGRTMHWSEDGSTIGGVVETYRDEPRRGEAVRVRHQIGIEIMYPEAGHLLGNITA